MMTARTDVEILCTLGPASMDDWVITRLEELGATLFRINLSHTKLSDLETVIRYVQTRTVVPVCLDTEGAQIRTGDLESGDIVLEEHSTVEIGVGVSNGARPRFSIYPPGAAEQLAVGDILSIDFNAVLVQVMERSETAATARVLTGGSFGSNKAASIDRQIALPSLTQKDRAAIEIGRRMGIRDIALSFANNESDVDALRALAGPSVRIIAKIESRSGIQHLEEIARRADAVLLDRGDMSREVQIEKIPRVQKHMLAVAKRVGIKAYVATNLLESMTRHPGPTRAEVNDVFNTLSDGADGLVLAAETAIGRYPVQSATMASKILRQFRAFRDSPEFSIRDVAMDESSLLSEPHGGRLIDAISEGSDIERAQEYPRLIVGLASLVDAEQIAVGSYSPVAGFMTREEVSSVLDHIRLPSGVVWPLPVVLQTTHDEARRLPRQGAIALCLRGTRDLYAVVHVEDIFQYDLSEIAGQTFGTTDDDHPGVKALMSGGDCFIGGRVELLRRVPSPLKHLELTPRQARAIFAGKGWSRVAGFHTRNVVHRAHEHIQMAALREQRCDGLFIHPAVGLKKSGDYSAAVVMEAYELMAKRHYPSGAVLLGASQNYSRYAGPREAIFTALCHKNFGCSHFIVGRDHAGTGRHFASGAVQKAFAELGGIGIVPVLFDEVRYCIGCASYVEHCEREGHRTVSISGTEARELLVSGQPPPEWFMRSDVAGVVLSGLREGRQVFV